MDDGLISEDPALKQDTLKKILNKNTRGCFYFYSAGAPSVSYVNDPMRAGALERQ
jgi:hypothetical protein